MSKENWDSRCLRCGRCCHEKIEHEGRVFYTDVACEYLDLQSRQCQIYSERHRLKPQCLPLTTKTLNQGILPQDCPYVADIKDYNPPQLIDDTD